MATSPPIVSLPLPLQAFTADGRLALWNNASAELSGYSVSSLLELEDAFAVLYPDACRSVLEGPAPGEPFEMTLRTRDGGLRTICWRALTTDVVSAFSPFGGVPTADLRAAAIGVDVTEGRRAIERNEQLIARLHQSERSLREAQRIAHIGSWEVDVRAWTLRWSDESFRIFGRDPKTFTPTNDAFFAAVHPDDLELVKEASQSAIDTGRPYRVEHRLIRPDGAIRNVLESAEIVVDDSGQVVSMIGTVQDITDQKLIEEQLAEAKRVAEEESRLKSIFVANMSHEIRTPLNGIIGALQWLMGSPLGAEEMEFARLAQGCADSLLLLVDDILDLSKIEAGKIDVRPAEFGVRELVLQVVQLFQGRAEERGVNLSCVIDESAPETVCSDPDRVRQILVNLLGNAVKFTEPAGSICVEVVGSSEPERALQISVRDTGIGIPKERLSDVFRAFTQVDGSPTRRHGGTGLGLAISRELAHCLGGHLTVLSEVGAGSTFVLDLPTLMRRERALPSLPRERRATGEWRLQPRKRFRPAEAPLRVLLVEDNQVNQRVGRGLIERDGHIVVTAENGSEAIELVRQLPFDLILMDIQMPVMDGLAATTVIRELERHSTERRFIVALTAHAMTGDPDRCLAAGMDDYIPKPLSLDRLNEVLTRAAELRATRAQMALGKSA